MSKNRRGLIPVVVFGAIAVAAGGLRAWYLSADLNSFLANAAAIFTLPALLYAGGAAAGSLVAWLLTRPLHAAVRVVCAVLGGLGAVFFLLAGICVPAVSVGVPLPLLMFVGLTYVAPAAWVVLGAGAGLALGVPRPGQTATAKE